MHPMRLACHNVHVSLAMSQGAPTARITSVGWPEFHSFKTRQEPMTMMKMMRMNKAAVMVETMAEDLMISKMNHHREFGTAEHHGE